MDDKFSAKREDLKRYFLEYGSLTAISHRYNISISTLSLLFKQCKLSIKKLRSARMRNKLLKDYDLLIQKLEHHPASTEFLKHAETKDLYDKIIKTFGSLNSLRITYNYSPAGKDKIENMRSLRAKEIYNAYILLGTLYKVSKKYNITRERVRQILQKGASLGLFKYPLKTSKPAPDITTEQLKKDYLLYGSKTKVARYCGINTKELSKLMTKYDLSCKELSHERIREKVLERYNEIVERLGHHPTTTELYQTSAGKVFAHTIGRAYGSMDNFRKAHGYPIPEKGGVKLAKIMQEKGKVNREKILDLLRTKTKAGISEMSSTLKMGYEIVRIQLLKLREEGIVDYETKGRSHYYFIKNTDTATREKSGPKLKTLKPVIATEDKVFINELTKFYIKYENMNIVAKKLQKDKSAILEKIDEIIKSKALFPITTRKAFILALRIKKFSDKTASLYKTSKKFGLHEMIINKYLRYGAQAGLFKYPTFYRYGMVRTLMQQDAYSKKSIQAILAVKKDFDTLGSCEEVAKIRGVSRERIRQILTMGSDFGLFEYPQKKKKLFSITKEELYNGLLRCKSIHKLSKLRKVNADEIKKAMEKYGISMDTIQLEVDKAKALAKYQDLVRKLGHHPSTTEIRFRHHYLLRMIKKGWSSIHEFRKAYGFPSPKLGAPEKNTNPT